MRSSRAQPGDPLMVTAGDVGDERGPRQAATVFTGRAVDYVLHCLERESVEVLFGIPGGGVYPLFQMAERAGRLRLIVAKHEEGSAFMADGYARAGGRLGVCAVTSGPGVTNLITAVAAAFADGVPLLVLTGQVATSTFGKGAMQEATREDIDVVGMLRTVTKYSAMVTSAQTLAAQLRRALRLALTGRRGPVHLNLPVDVWEQPVIEPQHVPATMLYDSRPGDVAAIDRAAELLAGARQPLILAGAGIAASAAFAELRLFAERLQARVATTARGKGVFPETHDLSLGILGMGGHGAAREAFFGDSADVVLAIGTGLGQTATLNWDPRLRGNKQLIQVDIDPDRIGRTYEIDLPVVADARAALTRMFARCVDARRNGPPAPPAPAAGPTRRDHDPLSESTHVPVSPQRWRRELEAALPDDASIFSDIGGHCLFNLHHLQLRDRQRFHVNLGFSAMGHGLAAPIGAKLAEPEKMVVAIVGDACFTMNGMEVLTAAEYEVPVVWIVENNQMHGITWHGSQQLGTRRPMTSVKYRRPIDVAAMATAMGASAFVVQKPGQLAGALAAARAAGGPVVIEILVDPAIPPPLTDRIKAIAGLAEVPSGGAANANKRVDPPAGARPDDPPGDLGLQLESWEAVATVVDERETAGRPPPPSPRSRR